MGGCGWQRGSTPGAYVWRSRVGRGAPGPASVLQQGCPPAARARRRSRGRCHCDPTRHLRPRQGRRRGSPMLIRTLAAGGCWNNARRAEGYGGSKWCDRGAATKDELRQFYKCPKNMPEGPRDGTLTRPLRQRRSHAMPNAVFVVGSGVWFQFLGLAVRLPRRSFLYLPLAALISRTRVASI